MITVSPASADFDKYSESEGYVDLTFSLSNLDSGKTITGLFIGETEIAKNSGANWSVSNTTKVVLKKAYLATLDVGDVEFTAVTTDGATVDFTVSITDTTPDADPETETEPGAE